MAAFLYENAVEPNSMPGNTSFVAGFVQGKPVAFAGAFHFKPDPKSLTANVGDTSPNTSVFPLSAVKPYC